MFLLLTISCRIRGRKVRFSFDISQNETALFYLQSIWKNVPMTHFVSEYIKMEKFVNYDCIFREAVIR